MTNQALWPLTATDEIDNDQWFTPTWIFHAAGVTFAMDVAAPTASEFRTCPAQQYLTVVDDGLTHPWRGLIWCNPPFSYVAPWVTRWANHPSGLLLVALRKESHWLGAALAAADEITVLSVNFTRPDGSRGRIPEPLLLAARGVPAADALRRVAQADRYIKGVTLRPWRPA